MLETSEIHGTWADHGFDSFDLTLPSEGSSDALWDGVDSYLGSDSYGVLE
jgi:hypothetical protein